MASHNGPALALSTEQRSALRRILGWGAGFMGVFGLMCAVFLAAMVYFDGQVRAQAERFRVHGVDRPAEVLRTWKETGASSGSGHQRTGGSIHRLAAVRWVVDGKSLDSVAVVNNAALWDRLRPGQAVVVRHVKDLPEFVLLQGDDADEAMDAEGWAFLAVGTVVPLALAAVALTIRRRLALAWVG